MPIHSFIHSVVCLKTGPQPLPKQVLHRVRSTASCSNFQHSPISLRLFNSCLRLLPRLTVTPTLLLSSLQKHVLEGSSYVFLLYIYVGYCIYVYIFCGIHCTLLLLSQICTGNESGRIFVEREWKLNNTLYIPILLDAALSVVARLSWFS